MSCDYTSNDVNYKKRIYLYAEILLASRKLKQYQRRIENQFGKVWVRDILGLLSWINVFSIISTFLLIKSNPRHFFYRIDKTINSEYRNHKTPINFLVSAVGLQLVFVSLAIPWWLDALDNSNLLSNGFLFGSDLSKLLSLMFPIVSEPGSISSELVWATLLGIPVAIFLICASCSILMLFIIPVSVHSIFRINWFKITLPLSPKTYLNIEIVKFLRCMLYFSIYSLFSMQVIQIILYTAWVELNNVLWSFPVKLTIPIFSLFLATWAYMIYKFIIIPYTEVIIYSSKGATDIILQSVFCSVDLLMFDLKEIVKMAIRDRGHYKPRIVEIVGKIKTEIICAKNELKQRRLAVSERQMRHLRKKLQIDETREAISKSALKPTEKECLESFVENLLLRTKK